MPTSPLSVVIQHLRADLGPGGDGVTDGELLARFVRSRDAEALAALVRRHAPMVWGVGRRLLNHSDAEDAFQATFLVLVRKAAGVPGHAVANWLYGVARQTAVRVRATAAKRGRRETQVLTMPEPTVPEVRDAELPAVVDEEVSRLPDHYRGVVVLCHLEGMTRTQAARHLGIPAGSVASRLARARVMLAKRLVRRGVVLSGSVAVPSAGSASASAPPALVESTIQAATLPAAGVVTANVAALTDAVVNAMLTTKMKSVLAVGLVVGLAVAGIGLGVGLATHPAGVAQGETPREGPVKEDKPTPPVVTKGEDKPPHFVETTDLKPQFGWLPPQVEGDVTAENIYVPSKAFIADIRNPGKTRFRELIDPRYLTKHGLTDRDLAYEIADNTGLQSYHVADDLRTILFVVDAKGGGRELIVARWVLHDGRLYLSPAAAPDPKTGIFNLWILRTKLVETKQPPTPGDKPSEQPPHVVEKPDQKGTDPRPWKVVGEPTAEQLLVVSKNFLSAIRSPREATDEVRFREYFDPRYLTTHGLTDKDIAFEVAFSRRITTLDVADDRRTVLCGIESQDGKTEAILLRWVVYEGHLYLSPEKAPDPKTGLFTPWILRTKVN